MREIEADFRVLAAELQRRGRVAVAHEAHRLPPLQLVRVGEQDQVVGAEVEVAARAAKPVERVPTVS